MKIKSIRELKNLKGQRVLLRVDFNVPISKDGQIDKSEDYKIVQTLPTIKYLIKKGAKIIILTHLGRPDGRVVEKLRLDPVAVRLSQLLNKGVYKNDNIVETGQAPSLRKQINELKNGDILMLDVEEGGEKASQLWAWFHYVRSAFPNNICMLYSRKSVLDLIVMTQSERDYFKQIPVWTSGYPDNPDLLPSVPSWYIPDQTRWGQVLLWQ